MFFVVSVQWIWYCICIWFNLLKEQYSKLRLLITQLLSFYTYPKTNKNHCCQLEGKDLQDIRWKAVACLAVWLKGFVTLFILSFCPHESNSLCLFVCLFVCACVCAFQLRVEPHSSTELGVRFSPSSIGEGNHTAKITFTCPQVYTHTHEHREEMDYINHCALPTHTHTRTHSDTHGWRDRSLLFPLKLL